MILCSCNNISDKHAIQTIPYKCGKCRLLTEFNNQVIIKQINSYTLMYDINKHVYNVYDGYKLIGEITDINLFSKYIQYL